MSGKACIVARSLVSVTAIISIAMLTREAMLLGIDGALYMVALVIIGGIAGYEVSQHGVIDKFLDKRQGP